MAHTLVGNSKLLNRVRRLRGQVDAIERALSADAPCGDLMRLIAATRGAINGIMAEVVNDHIQTHMIDEARTPSQTERDAAAELVEVLRTYIR